MVLIFCSWFWRFFLFIYTQFYCIRIILNRSDTDITSPDLSGLRNDSKEVVLNTSQISRIRAPPQVLFYFRSTRFGMYVLFHCKEYNQCILSPNNRIGIFLRTQTYSKFRREVSYHFIIKRYYCELNFTYQRDRFIKAIVCIQVDQVHCDGYQSTFSLRCFYDTTEINYTLNFLFLLRIIFLLGKQCALCFLELHDTIYVYIHVDNQ